MMSYLTSSQNVNDVLAAALGDRGDEVNMRMQHIPISKLDSYN